MTENQTQIIRVLAEIFDTKGKTMPPIGPESVLEELDLESLDFAMAVIRMEEITGKDPFATETEYEIKTLFDLAAMYD